MDAHLHTKDEHADRHLCVVSCQGDLNQWIAGSGGISYYWSVIYDRSRNAVGFRGFAATFQASAVTREVMDFTVQGPLITCLPDLGGVTQPHAIELSGSVATPVSTGGLADVPFDAKILVAPAPQGVRGGRNPIAAILRITNETGGTTVATVADLHRHEDWLFAIIAAAIPAVAVNGGAPLILKLMFEASFGDLNAVITTSIGTVTVNKPFTAMQGLTAVQE